MNYSSPFTVTAPGGIRMRAGENRGILSRVLTIYKQTFIFQIFHLFFFWKLKPPCPFRPVLWVGSGVTLQGTPVGMQAGWAGSEDLTSSKGSPRTREGHELLPFQEESPGKCEDPWTDPRGKVPRLQRSCFHSKANYCFGQHAGLWPPSAPVTPVPSEVFSLDIPSSNISLTHVILCPSSFCLLGNF